MSYIHAQPFAKLFDAPIANRDAIGNTLQKMAEIIAGTITFRRAHDREEAISDAVLLACRQFGRFDNSNGRAFSFFYKVMQRQMIKCVKKRKRIDKFERQNRVDEAML